MADEKAAILVVDDDESFGSMVAEVLRDKGHDATFLNDPMAAVEAIAKRPFAVAVLDLQMPALSGIELARRIRAQSADTQVVILTGHADLDSAMEGLQQGIFAYLPKQSLKLARLDHTVQEALAKWRLFRENHELVRRLTESNRLLQGLLEVGSSLAGEVHADRVLERLISSAREFCGAAAARAVLFGPARGGDGFVVENAVGDGGDVVRGARLLPGEGVARLVAETGETLRAENARDHPRYSAPCDELRPDGPGFLCAPLRHAGLSGAVMISGAPGGAFGDQAQRALELLARQAAVSIESAQQHESSVNFFTHASNLLVSILDRLDIFEPGHSQAVAALASMVTRRMGMNEAERRTVHFAALLHDIGKLALPASILQVEGFTAEAAQVMREHPALGVKILRPFTLWEDSLPIILAHHERWDGKGYPAGLVAEDIPLGARIVSVVEVFDAMTRQKKYGRTKTPDEALAELEACAGTQFDPRIVRLFVAEFRSHGDPRQGG